MVDDFQPADHGHRRRLRNLVSRMNPENHPDQLEWLSYVNASVLKVKLATAIIGISSIHLLKTFINAEAYSEKVLLAQAGIHIAFPCWPWRSLRATGSWSAGARGRRALINWLSHLFALRGFTRITITNIL